MATVTIRDSPVVHLGVSLSHDDIHKLRSVAKYNGITFASLARHLNLSRPYLYRALEDGTLELSKFFLLQHLIGCELITPDQIRSRASELASHILWKAITPAA